MMTEINSYSELTDTIKDKEKAYLLLFKKGSEQSDCAFRNIAQSTKQVKCIGLYYADVSKTRDIHPQFNITSVPSLLEFEDGVFKNLIKGCNNSTYYKALFDDAVYYAETRNDEKPQKRVTVYSTPTCSWCNALKSHLKLHKILYTDIDVSRDHRAADELVRRSGQMGVPQTDVNGEIIVGFNKTRINELLGIQG
jgi:glutaredoxin-like YruB-family protein